MLPIPVLAKVLLVFLLVVIAARRLNLGLAAAAGGILLAFWQGLSLPAIARSVTGELINPDLIMLSVLMIGIMAFSSAMKQAGAMNDLASALHGSIRNPRLALALAPLFIGTLPMPGGAIISAPLVDTMNENPARGKDLLATVNYWFRHILELVWPLFPAFVLTVSLSGIPTLRLILFNIYAPFVLFLLGYGFFLVRAGRAEASAASQNAEPDPASPAMLPRAEKEDRSFLQGVAPLAIVLGVYVVFDLLWELAIGSRVGDERLRALIGRYATVYAGLGAGSLYLLSLKPRAGIFHNSVTMGTMRMVLVIIGVRVFSALLTASNVAGSISVELSNAGIPMLAVITLLPFISGLVTGVGFGYVGLSMPIVLALLDGNAGMGREAGVVLAGACGFAGMMLSPLHVCMVVTAEHFRTSLTAMMRRFALPLGLFVLVAMGWSTVLNLLIRG